MSPAINPAQVLGRDLRMTVLADGRVQPQEEVWMIDCWGEKDCIIQDLGEPLPALTVNYDRRS